ncbi:helicase ARIP4 [Caerostris extrusa]|uniref:Helicase ARIP4 n=1 Tax=Caerostris extrusa TaxID=172846 RepID=A0AAV4XBB2_CAEEX|nr:helicase ARIP4 [Caerostris extrusa]
MEVFPSDDAQPNEVGTGTADSQLQDLTDWDESFASLEIDLHATKDVHSNIDNCTKDCNISNITCLNENQVKNDVKRKWEDENLITDDNGKHKLKRMDMLLDSDEVGIRFLIVPLIIVIPFPFQTCYQLLNLKQSLKFKKEAVDCKSDIFSEVKNDDKNFSLEDKIFPMDLDITVSRDMEGQEEPSNFKVEIKSECELADSMDHKSDPNLISDSAIEENGENNSCSDAALSNSEESCEMKKR